MGVEIVLVSVTVTAAVGLVVVCGFMLVRKKVCINSWLCDIQWPWEGLFCLLPCDHEQDLCEHRVHCGNGVIEKEKIYWAFLWLPLMLFFYVNNLHLLSTSSRGLHGCCGLTATAATVCAKGLLLRPNPLTQGYKCGYLCSTFILKSGSLLYSLCNIEDLVSQVLWAVQECFLLMSTIYTVKQTRHYISAKLLKSVHPTSNTALMPALSLQARFIHFNFNFFVTSLVTSLTSQKHFF